MQRSVSNRGLLNVEKDARSKTWKEGRKETERERRRSPSTSPKFLFGCCAS